MTPQAAIKVQLVTDDSSQRTLLVDFLARMGCDPVNAGAEADIVVVLAGAELEQTLSSIPDAEYSPPVLVFGPPAGEWRRVALESGAFALQSLDAPEEERASLVFAAYRFRVAQQEIRMIRQESELVCEGLLRSYGEEAQKLRGAVRERREVEETLERIRNRIIKSIL
jgi:hypothetical protein